MEKSNMKFTQAKMILTIVDADEQEISQFVKDNPEIKVIHNLHSKEVHICFETTVFDDLKKYPKLYEQYSEE